MRLHVCAFSVMVELNEGKKIRFFWHTVQKDFLDISSVGWFVSVCNLLFLYLVAFH